MGGTTTRPASPLWTPAREAACSNLREIRNAPKTHATQTSTKTAIKISAEGREIRDQRATYSIAAHVICTAVVAVMSYACTVNVATNGMYYVSSIYSSSSESYVDKYTYVVYYSRIQNVCYVQQQQ